MAHDDSVLFAISARLLLNSLGSDWSGKLKSFFSGKDMPHVSKVVMRTGQQYFIITAIVNIVTGNNTLAIHSPVMRALAAITNITIYNVMACRIHRKVKLGNITNESKGPTFPSGSTVKSLCSAWTSAGAFAPRFIFNGAAGEKKKSDEDIPSSTRLGQVQHNGNVGY